MPVRQPRPVHQFTRRGDYPVVFVRVTADGCRLNRENMELATLGIMNWDAVGVPRFNLPISIAWADETYELLKNNLSACCRFSFLSYPSFITPHYIYL